MTKKNPYYKRYSKADILRLKKILIETLKDKKTIQSFEQCYHVSPNTIKKWRETDPFFDQAVRDFSQKRDEEKSRLLHYVPLSDPEKKGKIIDDVCVALQNGAPLDVACLYANVTPNALKDLMLKDHSVMDRINKSEAMFILHQTKNITEKQKDDWKASAWLLERRYPQMYGQANREIRKPEPLQTAIASDRMIELEKDWSKASDDEVFN